MKYRAICESGITVKERVTIPEHLIPGDAQVEIQAKKSAGYFSGTDPSKVFSDEYTRVSIFTFGSSHPSMW